MTNGSKIIFYGWGTLLEQCFEQIVSIVGRTPDFIVDSDPSKHGRLLHGVVCIGLDQIAYLRHGKIFITVRNYESIVRACEEFQKFEISICVFERKSWSVTRITSPPALQAVQPVSLKGLTALVTGASRGLGAQVSNALSAAGCHLVLHARSVAGLASVADECRARGVSVDCVAADLQEPSAVETLAEMAGRRRIDILVNNAAFSPPIIAGDFLHPSASDCISCLQINSVSPLRLMQAVLPGMIGRNFGRIVNVSSSIQFRPDSVAYAMSKAALDKASVDMAAAVTGDISIVGVDPGAIATDMSGGVGGPVESAVTGVTLPIYLDASWNGRFITAQDYRGMSLQHALGKAACFANDMRPRQRGYL